MGKKLIVIGGGAAGIFCAVNAARRDPSLQVTMLEKTKQELMNANVLIQKFASMAAHDIKNPLSSIKLTSQALRTRNEIAQHDGCLRLVNMNLAATENLLLLVDEMMAYSKNPALLLERKQHFELGAMIQKIWALLSVPIASG